MPDFEVTLDSELDAHLKLESAIEKSRKAYEKHQEMMDKATIRAQNAMDGIVNQIVQQQNKATLSALSGQLAISADYSKEAQAPKAPGFLGNIIGKFGNIIGKLTGSMVASVASVLVIGMILVDVIKMSVKQSKILSNFLQTVGQALGLLVDLILLPFLPALVWALVTLYAAITGFGKYWSDVWETLKKEGLIGLIKLGLEWGWGTIEKWIQDMLKFIFSDAPLSEKIVNLGIKIGILAGTMLFGISFLLLGYIIDFLFGEGTAEKAKTVIINFAVGFIKDIGALLTAIVEFIFGTGEGRIKSAEKIAHLTLDIIKDIGGLILKILNFIFGVDNIKPIKELVLNILARFTGFVGDTWEWIKKIMGWNENTTITGISGGGGSVYTPKEISSSSTSQSIGGNTFIFQGLTSEQLPNKVREILRQDGARYAQ